MSENTVQALVAQAIRRTGEPFIKAAVVSRLAYEFKQNDPQFDEARFIESCGVKAS